MISDYKTKPGEDCPGAGIAKKYIKFLCNKTSFVWKMKEQMRIFSSKSTFYWVWTDKTVNCSEKEGYPHKMNIIYFVLLLIMLLSRNFVQAIDMFMSSCTFFVFLSLIEYAFVNVMMGDIR